jgi:hypothetical protein
MNVRLPPEPRPSKLRGQTVTVRFRVNELGQVDLGGTTIRGPIESPYLERFRAELVKWQFAPALLEGCAVPGSTAITVTFQ